MSATELGARAAAESAMQVLGGAALVVRLPLPPVAATDAEELGLASPEFRDVAVARCVVRTRSNGSRELLVDANALEGALAVSDAPAVQAVLASAAFVQVNGEAMLLRSVQVCAVGERAYLYRLLLRAADAEARG